MQRRPRRTASSIAYSATSVLPAPVGALTSTSLPPRSAAPASTWNGLRAKPLHDVTRVAGAPARAIARSELAARGPRRARLGGDGESSLIARASARHARNVLHVLESGYSRRYLSNASRRTEVTTHP